jgi:hypothetical protein
MAIETVRGEVSEDVGAEILGFWEGRGALSGDAARERLREVVCVLRDPAGAVVGVNSVYAESIPLIAGRVFWVYRSLLDADAAGQWMEMVRAAFNALEAKFDPEAGGPIGLCLLMADREEMRRRPEAQWEDPRMLYAGYLPDGRQVRIGYFKGARII